MPTADTTAKNSAKSDEKHLSLEARRSSKTHGQIHKVYGKSPEKKGKKNGVLTKNGDDKTSQNGDNPSQNGNENGVNGNHAPTVEESEYETESDVELPIPAAYEDTSAGFDPDKFTIPGYPEIGKGTMFKNKPRPQGSPPSKTFVSTDGFEHPNNFMLLNDGKEVMVKAADKKTALTSNLVQCIKTPLSASCPYYTMTIKDIEQGNVPLMILYCLTHLHHHSGCFKVFKGNR